MDTGFDGDLIVPAGLVRTVPAQRSRFWWGLADGSHVLALTYRGTIQIGQLGSIPVTATELGNEPLVGRGVSDRFGVTLDHGKRLVIEP